MAGKTIFQKLFTPVGVARYPHLNKPDTKFNALGVYHTKLVVSEAAAEPLIAKLQAILSDYIGACDDPKKRKTFGVAEVAEAELDEEGNETGNVVFKLQMKARVEPKSGKPFEQSPAIFDSSSPPKKLEADSGDIWAGSELRCQFEAIPYDMPSSKTFGVSLRLRAVQVVKLVSGGAGDSPFDSYEGGYSAPEEEANPFEATAGSGGDDGDY